LTQQTIGIFVRTSLIRTIRISKVTAKPNGLFQFLKSSEFFAIVKGHCFAFWPWNFSEKSLRCHVHTLGTFIIHPANQQVTALALNMGSSNSRMDHRASSSEICCSPYYLLKRQTKGKRKFSFTAASMLRPGYLSKLSGMLFLRRSRFFFRQYFSK